MRCWCFCKNNHVRDWSPSAGGLIEGTEEEKKGLISFLRHRSSNYSLGTVSRRKKKRALFIFTASLSECPEEIEKRVRFHFYGTLIDHPDANHVAYQK
jgi:hypothetical protein